MLFGCSTVGMIVVMWGNCVLRSFLKIWVVLVFNLPFYYRVEAIVIILGIILRLFMRGVIYSNLMLFIYIQFPVVNVGIYRDNHVRFVAGRQKLWP
jgi:hypothetical protein